MRYFTIPIAPRGCTYGTGGLMRLTFVTGSAQVFLYGRGPGTRCFARVAAHSSSLAIKNASPSCAHP